MKHLSGWLLQDTIKSFLVLSVLSVCFISETCNAESSAVLCPERISLGLSAPTAVAVDGENVWVAESEIRKISRYGREGKKSQVLLGERPVSIAADRGKIMIGSGAGSVEVYDSDFRLLFKLGGGTGEFSKPSSIATDGAGAIYVTDSGRDKVEVYNPDGRYRGQFTNEVRFPTGIAIDRKRDEVIISDLPLIQTRSGRAEGARIQVFDLKGKKKRSFGEYGEGEGELIKPMGVAVDGEGRIYVSDAYRNSVEVFDGTGKHLDVLYDEKTPLRTPLGISHSGGLTYIASPGTGSVEVYSLLLPELVKQSAKGAR